MAKFYRRKRPKKLSLLVIDQIFTQYCDGVSQVEIAANLGISSHTVSTYIKRGDPNRHIPPLRDRKARVMAALYESKDNLMIDRLSGLLHMATRTAAQAGSRVLDRMSAAAYLDDPSLRLPGREIELEILEHKALDPDMGDMKTAVNVTRDLVRDIRRVVSDTDDRSAVTVNVSQGQVSGQGNGVIQAVSSASSMDGVLAKLSVLSNPGREIRRTIHDEVERLAVLEDTPSNVVGDSVEDI